jgi:ABC-type transporter Mla maintaining outer membrane lipid asymmetry ATPase subunit MlaF
VVFKNGIHIWIRPVDEDNANLMILLSFIILGHPDWKQGNIRIFSVCRENEHEKVMEQMEILVQSGRLPITWQNIEILIKEEQESTTTLINRHSADAALTMIGFREARLRNAPVETFTGYDELGNVLFLNSRGKKLIV